MSGWAMTQFLNGLDLNGSRLKPFLLENSERVKDYAVAMAQKHGRPFQYLVSHIRKEDTARQLAERDGIEEGLVCIFSILEPCRTFSLRPRCAKQGPSLALAFCFKKGGFFVRCLHFTSTSWIATSVSSMRVFSHSTLSFGAREVMNFLGRKLHGKFEGEIVSDLSSLVCRRTGGSRIKHRVQDVAVVPAQDRCSRGHGSRRDAFEHLPAGLPDPKAARL